MSQNLVAALARFRPFSELPLRAVADVSRFVAVQRMDVGDTIFAVGETADTLILVASGELRLVAPSGRAVDTVRPGESLGITGPMLPSRYTMSGICGDGGALISLSAEALNTLWEQIPPAAALLEMAMAASVVPELREATEALGARLTTPIESVRHSRLRRALAPRR